MAVDAASRKNSPKIAHAAHERIVDIMPRVTLRQLAYLVTTARCESLTRAAEELHVSPPSVSTALAELESLIGVQLFVRRHARGLVLTQVGRDLVVAAREILVAAREFQSRSDTLGGALEGIIDFGCLLSFAPYFVPPLVHSFYDNHPKVRIRWHEGDHAALIAALEAGTIDCALIYDFDIPSSVQCTPIRQMPLQIVLPAGHRWANRASIALADMVDEPFVLLDLPLTHDYLLSTFAELKLEPRIAHHAHSYEMARGLVANGFGYTLLNFCPPYGYATPGGEKKVGLVSRPMSEHLRWPSLSFARLYRYKMPRLVEEFMTHVCEFVAHQAVNTDNLAKPARRNDLVRSIRKG